MNAVVCRLLDRVAIQFAAARAPRLDGKNPHIQEARAFLESEDFISREAQPARVELGARPYFSFPTPRPTPYLENNLVHGRLYRCERQWQERPTLILLHGWNDVLNHHWRFPLIAAQINRQGMNAATLEAPYHFRRRPRDLGSWSNFLCPDILRTVQATAQGIAEIQAFAEWLRQQGCPAVGLWGISLGAWLAGLAGCHDARWTCLTLVTPVAKLDQVLENVAFCRHIRAAFQGQPVDAAGLNLVLCRPAIPKHNILIIEAEHDLFIAKDSVEELWRAWGEPPILRLREGHISAPSARGLAAQIIGWAGPLLCESAEK
ncbi:MAG TPA: alpha/beta hydrolase family protein [Verrucomicrobiae bacterium]|jgi:dienelactone hydrolase|nr:alpha/beta hydrolase family protein [Verrucomicrobiae bacterium]